MNRKILVSRDSYETRVAVVENGHLAEYYFERTAEERVAGNLYKGRVMTIVPGMEAAFVDIGLPRNAFLYVADICSSADEYSTLLEDENGNGEAEEDVNGDAHENLRPHRRVDASIGDLLKDGQEVLVQIDKEPIGAKGSRVTTNISLPGRFLVLLPMIDNIGISLRISEEEERDRLRSVAQEVLPEGFGAIVRTAAEGHGEDDLRRDAEVLVRQWQRIQENAERAKAPSLIHRDLGLVERMIRDLFDGEMVEVVCDDSSVLDEIRRVASDLAPSIKAIFRTYEESVPLLKDAGVEAEVQNILRRRVWLPSGGYIVIDEAEALTAIDVNTGRYLGKDNLEETVLATNLEAAAEIARQLRLRDIGGIIIIDFIDMREAASRDTVLDSLSGHLAKDRSRTQILQLTKLGLVEMTRKRVRKSLVKSLTQTCPYCKRQGTVLSLDTMVIRVLRRVEDLCKTSLDNSIVLQTHEQVAICLNEDMTEVLEALRSRYRKEIVIQPVPYLHFEEIRDGSSLDGDYPLGRSEDEGTPK